MFAMLIAAALIAMVAGHLDQQREAKQFAKRMRGPK